MKLANIDLESLVIKPQYYKRSGKSIYVSFDKKFETAKTNLNTFIIQKNAYVKNSDSLCRYANHFFKEYDKDNEFLSALVVVKYQIDNKTMEYTYDEFMSDIKNLLLSPSIVEKIYKMVDDYYSLNLDPTDEVKNVDLHALQFMNIHGKSIMAISLACKLTIPVVCHYYAINGHRLKPDGDQTIYYTDSELDDNNDPSAKKKKNMAINIFLYRVFCSYYSYLQGDFNLYNKFFATILNHIHASESSDSTMWLRIRNKAITPTISMNDIMRAVVVDIVPKAMFTKNIVYLFQVAIPQQLKNILIAKDDYEYSNISMISESDKLSGLEKVDANFARISDLDIIISELNIRKTLKRLKKDCDIKITDDEVNFYKTNLTSFAFTEMIIQFFAKYFGGSYDLKSISRNKFIILIILFKRMMKQMGYIYIHQIMTGNVSKTIKRRKVSTKQLAKIKSSKKFEKVMQNYSMAISADNTNNSLCYTIASLINTPIECVDYEDKEHLGELIIADIDVVTDEFLRFVKMIY